MAVIIRGNHIISGSRLNNTGVFIGQNIQDGWDSIVPEKYTTGFLMGDACMANCAFSGYFSWSILGQPTFDTDWKENFNQNLQS